MQKTCFVFILFFATVAVLQAKICKFYTTSDTIFNSSPLALPISTSPVPLPINCWGPCEMYLWGSWATKLLTAQNTCLGLYGPISALGPLGPLGPLGSGTYSPADVMKTIGNWEKFKALLGKEGPLDSEKGPMSVEGPLGDSFFTVMPNINDFTKHMMGGGLWSVLGPVGPLGALGPLGPLGPVGAHGFGQNKNGDFVDAKNKIVKTVKATWNKTLTLEWPLYERYTPERAMELSKTWALDTSFMVTKTAGLSVDKYQIVSEGQQFLTVLVVPSAATQLFDLRVKTEKGEVLAEAKNTNYYQSFVQLRMDSKKPEKLVIEVNGRALNCNMFGGCDGEYTLYVTGSTSWMLRQNHIQYVGDYIKNC